MLLNAYISGGEAWKIIFLLSNEYRKIKRKIKEKYLSYDLKKLLRNK